VVLPHPVFAQVQGEQQADIAFVGLHGGIFESLKEFEKELDVKLEYLTDEMIASGKLDLSAYKVIFLQHLRRDNRDTYRAIFQSAKKKNPELRIISISGRFDMLKDLNIVEHDPEVRKYYGSSKENLRRLLIYTLAKYIGRELEILPPEEVSFQVIYHPDYGGFKNVQEFLNWSRKRGWDVENAPRALITVHTTHLVFQQPKVVDALIREFEKQKILTVAMIDTAEGYGAKQYEAMVFEYNPEAVIHTCHSRENVSFREKLQAPHLHSIFFRKQSIDEWYKGDRGLDPGAVTFQIMTQELRGAIEPQIGAGTLLGGGSDEAFTPIPERIEHLVKRAASWINLQRKKNEEKRVAIIYYDRELGKSELMRGTATGMFMNAPRSLINLLRKMKEVGYSITKAPEDEDELISWMMERGRQIGIWAPGELDRLVRNGKPVLIPTATYVKWFEQKVPEAVREGVIKRWGAPPGRF
ncbi:MAG TPA: cobaltochelatase subunit CobN, partial [Desulfobacterales bacterium]|nr:cobaltochelatase subunit CobN [Desulfobacterales bacterium]